MPPKRKLDYIFVIDISNKINGDIVNNCIKETLATIDDVQTEHQELEIVISSIAFSESAKCIVEQVKIIDYSYSPIIFDGVQKSEQSICVIKFKVDSKRVYETYRKKN